MTVGFAMCGSFCTFSNIYPMMWKLSEEYDLIPIFSQSVSAVSSRFGSPEEFRAKAEEICGKPPIVTIAQAEPIGPQKMLDALIIAPCTGNTLAKLSHSIADTPVTMAAKSHLRNARPVLVAVSTNDGLAGAAENIGKLLARKHYYFVPFRQDDPVKEPTSLVADFSQLPEALRLALAGKQLQPILAR